MKLISLETVAGIAAAIWISSTVPVTAASGTAHPQATRSSVIEANDKGGSYYGNNSIGVTGTTVGGQLIVTS